MDENKIFDLLEKIYVEVKGHTEQFKNVESRLDNLEIEIKNNSVKIESAENTIQKLSEVQKSYIEQNEKQHIEIIIPMKEKTDVIELAVKDTSKDVHELNDKFDKVEKVTMQNLYDVAYLKAVK